jgi:hypothetical protein
MIKLLALSAILITASGCVSTHPGVMSKSSLKDNKLKVSVQNQDQLSDKYYMFLEYTFENTSAEWLDVKATLIGFYNTETEILVNDKLSAWIEGAELKLKKNNHNTAVILGSIAAVGGIAGGLSSNDNVQVAGIGVALGAVAAGTVIGVQQDRTRAASGNKGLNQTVQVPKNHVFAPFKVAPGSYVKRWVVVKRPPYENDYEGNYDMFTNLKQNDTPVTYKTSVGYY